VRVIRETDSIITILDPLPQTQKTPEIIETPPQTDIIYVFLDDKQDEFQYAVQFEIPDEMLIEVDNSAMEIYQLYELFDETAYIALGDGFVLGRYSKDSDKIRNQWERWYVEAKFLK
jgi:hypothetical protein